ncbi:methionyl-tRNA formyltransferase [Geothrix sp. PMB-07]|uniref:methionyl-tRNA formyltransferase n=1 Tax=Geothrix sp. PMB-07 TaxID=3068640 RepID=UPI0027403D13|nr:methionyl-tRNA formyltransferase [Geothrix sp. PMB-07]WLT31973.1 methionyl-tRNA formyltransferase [Geothrix sp. PMB-07]
MVRIAFLGTPRAAVPVLRALAEEGVEAVFCNPDRPAGRGRHLEAPPVKVAAQELGLPLHQPLSWKAPETRELWESLRIDLAVVVAYGHILPRWMLDSCALGTWNLHFSLLPRWRGAAPVNHALLAGDEETGVSLMRITPGLDEGPVLSQSHRDITQQDTAESLLTELSSDAAELLMDQLPLLLSGSGQPKEQAHDRATYAAKLRKDMGHLDWRRPASVLHRQVRALWPWPGSEVQVDGQTLKVCGVGSLRPVCYRDPGQLLWGKEEGAWLVTSEGALELTHLQRPGKPVQPALQALQPWGVSGSRPLA